MTPEGESAVAGLVAGLPDAHGVLAGSVLSGQRMQPGHWAGAYVCWGTENREAAVRFLVGGPSNPYGANIEVKVIDPSANPYFATATILGLALDGIERKLSLPPETTVDPATLTEAAVLGARLWRNGIRDVVQGFVDADEWSPHDARRVVDLIANGNAKRVYQIG